MPVLGVIPARYGASRLPGKPLALLGGVPMVVRVLERAREASRLDSIVVATDDHRIEQAVRSAGGTAMMTPADLPSGSDRAAWVVRELGEGVDIVVNIQGDEPFLPGSAIDAVIEALDTGTWDMATLGVPLSEGERETPSVVKVLADNGRAVDFSRSAAALAGSAIFKHVGLYGFHRACLEQFVGMPPSPREAKERLEQLRAVEAGTRIALVLGDWRTLGIDTPEDLETARRMWD